MIHETFDSPVQLIEPLDVRMNRLKQNAMGLFFHPLSFINFNSDTLHRLLETERFMA